MGCDIHAFKEVKVNGQWHCFGEAPIERNYRLFGWMAGVRQPEERLFITKGLPDDVTVPVKFLSDGWDCDGHTHSYLTSSELKELRLKIEKEANNGEPIGHDHWATEQFGDIGCKPVLGMVGYDDLELETWVEDHRLVFWFDN